MKRFQLSMSVTALIIGMAVAGSVHAGDKGHGQHNLSGMTAKQNGPKITASSSGGQSGSIANNLKKQTILQNKSNGTSNLLNKKLDSKQIMNKNNGQMAKKQIDMKKKDDHFKGIKSQCYFGKNTNFWSNHCWNDKFGCETYFCSTRHCWYFWYEPYGCYLPTTYWATYCEPVVEVSTPVVEVTQPVEVVQPVQQVVEVAPVLQVRTVRVVRPYILYSGPGFGFCGPTFPYTHVRF